MQTQTMLMSREGGDANHRALRDVPVFLPVQPRVGAPLRMWTNEGEVVTSTVRHVTWSGTEIVVETANSRYRLQAS